MSHPKSPADLRDERAADRDDTADHRDDTAHGRDDAADGRDVEAAERDDDARQGSSDLADLTDRVQAVCDQIVARFARSENVTTDAGDWPDLTPAALARLDAYGAEQRRLARRDREAVTDLLDRLRYELNDLRRGRHAAARDRQASARDRHHSADNRHEADQDRNLSAKDRSQVVIEREQVDPRDLPQAGVGPAQPGP